MKKSFFGYGYFTSKEKMSDVMQEIYDGKRPLAWNRKDLKKMIKEDRARGDLKIKARPFKIVFEHLNIAEKDL